MSLAEIAEVVGGALDGVGAADVRVSAPATLDSRDVVTGGLFIAVAGEHVDGHDYALGAVTRGAAGALASRPCGVSAVLVDDPVKALGRLARHVLDQIDGLTVLALTGSQGKTGTKDYLAELLAPEGPTVATSGNHNNELGVPLTVLRVESDTRYLVVEMGARGVGHIAELCAIAPPTIAAVLNVGTAHVGEFGGRDMIARAKGEILEALTDDGIAVFNADDEFTSLMGARTRAVGLTFGRAGDVRWRDLRVDQVGRPSFELGYAGQWAHVTLGQLGFHQVENAAAAAAMAIAAGVGLTDAATRLSSVSTVSRWRMEPRLRADGLLVVNDAYNANPESMSAAVETLGHIGRARPGRSIAVLGEMLELGEDAGSGHRSVGLAVAAAEIDVLITVGEASEQIAEGARAVSSWVGESIITASRCEALSWLKQNVSCDDAVLVKASRGAALELIVDGILLEGAAAR